MRSGKLFALLSAAVMLAGCASGEDPSQSVPDGSSQASVTSVTTTAATTTTTTTAPAQEDTSSAETQNSGADSSSHPEKEKTSNINPAMWEVTSGNGGRLVMIGTVHALDQEDYPLPERITGALDSADALAVECDVAASDIDPALLLKEIDYMYYQNGDTVDNHISAEVLESVGKYAESIGMNLNLYKTCRPWVYLSLFESDMLNRIGMSSDLGLDNQLIRSAKDSGKELIELESAEMQLEMMSGFSDSVLEMMLAVYTTENAGEIKKSNEEIFDNWRKGDFEALESFYSKKAQLDDLVRQGYGPETEEYKLMSEYIDRIQTDRNKAMAEKAAGLLEKGRNVFLAVGTAHFCGSEGIVSLLEEKGYTVKRI